jgi:hypothetical protein
MSGKQRASVEAHQTELREIELTDSSHETQRREKKVMRYVKQTTNVSETTRGFNCEDPPTVRGAVCVW